MVRLLVLSVLLGGGVAPATGCDPIVDADYVGEPGGMGNVEICEAGPQPDADGCTSTVDSYGFLCTDCGDTTECLPAQCDKKERCLECVDPKGRVGLDCCNDYVDVKLTRWRVRGADTLNSCEVVIGAPTGSTAACNYPGSDTCTFVDEVGGGRTFSCRYQDGTSRSVFLFGDEPPPDWTRGRPALPEPGRCVTEQSPDGYMTCTSCTYANQSAMVVCHLEKGSVCEWATPDRSCVRCAGLGWTRTVCDPPAEP